jgi:uncharacterized protein YlxP (DUF503 family)
MEFLIPGAQSLKDKRMIVRSMKDRLGRKYNVSVAEVDHNDLLQRAVLGVALVSKDRQHLEAVFQKIENEVAEIADVSLISFEKEYI